jgi:hypothetical protein
MIRTSKRNIHWDYYVALESDIHAVARYIEFDESNFDTHSIELAHLLLAASSEVDVVLREMCKIIDSEAKAGNIDGYKKVVKEHLPGMIDQNVVCPLYGLTLSPWLNWGSNRNPIWWQSYNKVKHERNIHFNRANLKNVLNSIAGLFVVNIYYNNLVFRSENKDYFFDLRDAMRNLKPKSGMFRLDDLFIYLEE